MRIYAKLWLRVEGTDCRAICARAQTLEPSAHIETLSLPLISATVGPFALPTSTSIFSLPKHSNDGETLLPLCVRGRAKQNA